MTTAARIQYEQVSENPFAIRVTLDGKMVGFIRQDGEGFYYAAQKHRGETFASVDEVKRSLEDTSNAS